MIKVKKILECICTNCGRLKIDQQVCSQTMNAYSNMLVLNFRIVAPTIFKLNRWNPDSGSCLPGFSRNTV